MEGGLRFTLLTQRADPLNKTLHYCSFNESDLEDCSGVHPKMCDFLGQLGKDLPICHEIFRVDATLFMVGGNILRKPTKCMWKVDVASLNVDWTLCPTPMNVERSNPVLLPLRDGRIFICGGTAELESWAEIYDPVKGQFEARKLYDDEIGYPYPNSCFQWTDQVVVIYYHGCLYETKKLYQPTFSYTETSPSLLSYNMQTHVWKVIAQDLPEPLHHMEKRNLVYVGCDTLFIIDSTYRWFVYHLSSNEKVGKVKVEGQRVEDEDRDAVVLGAVYAPGTSIQIYLFEPDWDNLDTSLRYSKFQLVQTKAGDYVATICFTGLLTVGVCTGLRV